MNKKIIFLLIIIALFISCDLLRFSPFEVTSWGPGEGYHSNPQEIDIYLIFSQEPDKNSVERRFSLNSDSGKVKGNFHWEGYRVKFIPLVPLEKNRDYNLILSAEASNTNGLSMDMAFDRSFTTRENSQRPGLISFYPQSFEQIDDTQMKVKLNFSNPVQLNTLYNSVSFTPSMTGIWHLEEEGKLAVFTPSEHWTLNKRYEMRISTALADNNGMSPGNEFISVFTIGTDFEKPVLLSASRIGKNTIELLQRDNDGFTGAVSLLVENEGWEKDDKLLLEFSKPVDVLSVKNNLTTDEGINFVLENTSGYKNSIIFHLETIPAYESRFTIRLKAGVKDAFGNASEEEYIYRIFANGEFSKPPVLMGVRIPLAPENKDMELVSFGSDSLFKNFLIKDDNYPSAVPVNTWIELYFDTAKDASVNLFSVMELFRVETSNNVLTFLPRQIINENFTITEPDANWENFKRIEIKGILTNSVNFGIVNFQIGSGLTDSLGNKNENPQRISLVK